MTVDCDNSNAEDDTCRHRVDADESVAMAVVTAVAAASGRDPTGADGLTGGLDPLATAIDPEALDRVVESGGGDRERAICLEFRYCDHQVTVAGGETTTVAVR